MRQDGTIRLTRFADYSLRVLIHLGIEPERRATIAQIAGSFCISENPLTKVVHFLGKAGFLVNVRGRGGGMQPARVGSASICNRGYER